ncbi:MAG: ChaN family lipoprotein [Desulfococcaceae bacterium]
MKYYMCLLILVFPAVLLIGCAGQEGHMFMKSSQEKPMIDEADYRVYRGNGNAAGLADIVIASENADVIFIGESHGDPAAHFLEEEIFREIYCSFRRQEDARPVVLSMEMFERDVQPVMDEYLADLISERHFTESARPWHSYRRDYRPLVEFAKENRIPVIAANAPGRYVNRVSRLGSAALNDLPPSAKGWLPPLPYATASPGYREKFKKFWDESEKKRTEMKEKGHKMSEVSAGPKEQFQFEALLAAQSLWDASMAHAISLGLKENSRPLILHVNGQFHSAQGMGIPEHLLRYCPDVRILTVTILPVAGFPEFQAEVRGAGDFVILTDPKLLRPVMEY